MDLRQFQAVLAVAHHRNFTRAAESLLVAQPAVSAQVRKLEQELGVRLFERTTRHVELTDAGRLVVDRAAAILAAVEALGRDVGHIASPRRGLVRIGAGFSYNAGLPSLLARFVEEHPDIDITMKEAGSVEMFDMLRARDLEVAFATLSPGLNLKELRHHVYVEEPFVLMVPPGSGLARKPTVAFHDIADLPLVMHQPGSAIRRLIEHAFAAIGRTARVIVETSGPGHARHLVAEGIGAAMVPLSVASGPGPEIRFVKVHPTLMRVSVLAWREDIANTAGRKFIEYVLEQPSSSIVSTPRDVAVRRRTKTATVAMPADRHRATQPRRSRTPAA